MPLALGAASSTASARTVNAAVFHVNTPSRMEMQIGVPEVRSRGHPPAAGDAVGRRPAREERRGTTSPPPVWVSLAILS